MEHLSYCDKKFVYIAFGLTSQPGGRWQPKYKPTVLYRKIPKEIFYTNGNQR